MTPSGTTAGTSSSSRSSSYRPAAAYPRARRREEARGEQDEKKECEALHVFRGRTSAGMMRGSSLMIPSIPLSTRVVASAGSFTVHTKTATPSAMADLDCAGRDDSPVQSRGARARRAQPARKPAGQERAHDGKRRPRDGAEHAAAGHAEAVFRIGEGPRQPRLRRSERGEDRERVGADEAALEQGRDGAGRRRCPSRGPAP